MSSLFWTNPVSGNWADGSKWDLGAAPTSSDDASISGAGAYAVGVTSADAANSLVFNALGATLSESATGSLSITNALTLEAGTMVLRGANTLGGFNITGGVLQLFNGAALGGANATLMGGEISGMANETVTNELLFQAGSNVVIDAATGTTLNLQPTFFSIDNSTPAHLQFGSASRKGTVVFTVGSGVIGSGLTDTITVAGGTFKAGDATATFLTSNAASTTIAAGATFDVAGFSTQIDTLDGAGSVIDSGAAAALKVVNGFWQGVISGPLSVTISGSAQFTGANTYTGGTTINGSQTLFLSGKGSITGKVIDNGTFYDFDSGGTVTLGAISGSGNLILNDATTLALTSAGSFTGGATIGGGGTVSLATSSSLGTGNFIVDGGELENTASLTLTNAPTLRDNVTLAAATGTTLAFAPSASSFFWDATSNPLTVTFGDATHAGVVLLKGTDSSYDHTNPIHVKMVAGTVRDGSSELSFFLSGATDLKVSAGATWDLGGFSSVAPSLTSAGTITNSSSTAVNLITEGNAAISGVIGGKLSLEVASGTAILSGANTYNGGTTIDGGATLQLGAGTATGSIVGAVNDAGSFVIQENGPVTLSGKISGAGSLLQTASATTTLSGVNTFSGGTTLEHGEIIVTNGAALGTGSVTLDAGELLATASMSLAATQNPSNTFTFNGSVTIAAAHGTTLNIGGAPVQVNTATLNFGEGANDGVVVFKVVGGSDPGPFKINVNAGTLRAGDSIFGLLAEGAKSVTIATGAVLDTAGFDVGATAVLGTGQVINSLASKSILADGSGTFAGVISGNIQFQAAGAVTLTGASTYTGGTLILSGDSLQLGNGGATGSILHAIDDEGTLIVDVSVASAFAGLISGAGVFVQQGAGTTTLSAGNTYTGGTTIQHGELISGNTKALGVGGTLAMTGGELLSSANQTQTHDLHTGGSVTIAAADGTILNLDAGNFTGDAGHLFFGEGANDGTINFEITGSFSLTDSAHTFIEVRAGTVRATNDGFGLLMDSCAGAHLDTGTTVNLGGFSTDINSLTGTGNLTNTAGALQLELFGATNFGGVISGAYTEIDIFNTAILAGNETFTGKAVIEGGNVTLSGLFNEAVSFNGGTLVLTVPAHFTGHVQNFASGDTIDLRNITKGASATVSYNTATGVLTVSDGTHTDHVTFTGALVQGNFGVSADGSGGTDVSWQTPPPAPAAQPARSSAAPITQALASFQVGPAPAASVMPAYLLPKVPLLHGAQHLH